MTCSSLRAKRSNPERWITTPLLAARDDGADARPWSPLRGNLELREALGNQSKTFSLTNNLIYRGFAAFSAIMVAATQKEDAFPVREAREIVKDLLPPNPFIYWMDFLFHVTLGWGAFILTLTAQPLSPGQCIFFIVSALALFRAVIFIHELTHLRKDSFKIFRVVWNVLCGFPIMVPSFIYQGVHNDHHKRNLYGTEGDGEYFPFVVEGRFKIVLFVLVSFLLPIFFFVRFVFLTPLSYGHKKLRSLVLEKASSLSIDLSYRRTPASLSSVPTWRVQESATCLYGWTVVLLVIEGILPPAALVLWYFIMATIFFINALRTLAAHCYRHSGRQTLGFEEQLLDSVNIPNVFGVFWAPVGLRFHATHHLIPEIPYHALGKAHRLLLEGFSEKNLYSETMCLGLWLALGRLWRESGEHG